MLTVPWLITSYARALYGADATPFKHEDSQHISAVSSGAEREIKTPSHHLRQQQIQQAQKEQHQQQLPQPSRLDSHTSHQQRSKAPSPRQTKLPVSANISSKTSVSPICSTPQPIQAQVAGQLQGELPRQADSTIKTSTKSLVLRSSSAASTMGEQWIQKQLEAFQFNFDQADKDKSGCLSFCEIYGVLQAQGFKGSEDDAMLIFKHLDRDRSKTISREEFTDAIKKIPKMSIKEFCLRKMFKSLDRDGSGYLSRAEIMDATKKELVGMDISEERISELLIAHCKDDDSKMHYEEFLTLFGFEIATSVVHHMFTKMDTDGSGFLTKDEVLGALSHDSGHELTDKFADKISDLVIHLVTDSDKKISFEEFTKVWLRERQKAKK